jgi:hypothetical protein
MAASADSLDATFRLKLSTTPPRRQWYFVVCQHLCMLNFD